MNTGHKYSRSLLFAAISAMLFASCAPTETSSPPTQLYSGASKPRKEVAVIRVWKGDVAGPSVLVRSIDGRAAHKLRPAGSAFVIEILPGYHKIEANATSLEQAWQSVANMGGSYGTDPDGFNIVRTNEKTGQRVGVKLRDYRIDKETTRQAYATMRTLQFNAEPGCDYMVKCEMARGNLIGRGIWIEDVHTGKCISNSTSTSRKQ